ncbi:glycosyltransferase family 39 protein [Desulfoluna sp.]|uniref:ArnT family glycosyltransferase n=1 Tax=Desulfoluna sp. TaxID=2045199 RepID=UPI0026306C03|nr:glycosyltransferase family 39 protein [Desulfoluna sp.]
MVRIDKSRVALSLTLLLMVIFVLPFAGMRGEAPFVTDDPIAAAAALDMTGSPDRSLDLTHEFLTDLPPLYPMAAALVTHVMGPSIGDRASLRLTSALFSLGTLVLFYFFARRYGNRHFALLAVALLATMPGFALDSSSIGRDAALGFFLLASVIAISLTFFDESPLWLLGGGVATAGAFLTGAWDGLALTGCLWGFGLIWFLATQKPSLATGVRYLFFHLTALLAFLVLTGAGIATQIIAHPRPRLNDGFWIPLGTPTLSPDLPTLMLNALALTWPWTPLFCLYMGSSFAGALKNRGVDKTPLFLAAWFFSALVPLLSGTTGITPMLPPLALMAAFAFHGTLPRWMHHYATLWSSVVLGGLFLMALSPAFRPLINPAENELLRRLLTNGPHTILAAAGFLLAAMTCLVKSIPLTRTGRLITLTAIFWVALLHGPFATMPVEEQAEIQPLITAFQTHPHKKTAAFGVDRQLRASLCFYGHLHLPPMDNLERCYDILKGGDPDFDTLLMQSNTRDHLPEALSMLPVTIVMQLPLHKGGCLLWVKGR